MTKVLTSRLILTGHKVKHNHASVYHVQSQEALERFHKMLKSLLRSYCVELGGDWEEGLPWLMLSAQEVVQESTEFSPDNLVFGRTVCGPLVILRDDLAEVDPPTNLIDYVNGFRHRLFTPVEQAFENLDVAQSKMKNHYNC